MGSSVRFTLAALVTISALMVDVKSQGEPFEPKDEDFKACAVEGMECACDGVVRYGSIESNSTNGTWAGGGGSSLFCILFLRRNWSLSFDRVLCLFICAFSSASNKTTRRG